MVTHKNKVMSENKELLSDYEFDSMWMSYRYCIGRHTIATLTRANDIASHCYGRMSEERSIFIAFDINREIERCLQLEYGPSWHFPITSFNRIYTSAIDIFCQFIEDFDIKSKEDYLKYYKIDVILTDNERGYKIETTTWEEYLRPEVHKIVSEFYHTNTVTADYAWQYFEKWDNNEDDFGKLGMQFHELTKRRPNSDYFCFYDIEDLFIWNDLARLFDLEHHYTVELFDGTVEEVFDSWREKRELRDDGYLYIVFGYEKVIISINSFSNGHLKTIPKEYIKRIIK